MWIVCHGNLGAICAAGGADGQGWYMLHLTDLSLLTVKCITQVQLYLCNKVNQKYLRPLHSNSNFTYVLKCHVVAEVFPLCCPAEVMTYRKRCAEELESREWKPGFRHPFFETSCMKELYNWSLWIWHSSTFLVGYFYEISMEAYLIWQYFLFRMDVVALECFVHCENILWKYMFSGGNLDKSLGLLKRRLEKCGQENFSKHILQRKKRT